MDKKKIVISKQGRNNKEFHFDEIFNTENNADIFEISLKVNWF